MLDENKYWLKFIITGKAEEYLNYRNAKKAREESEATDNSFFDGRIGDKGKQYRG
ncbi:MAG: hypothetical protein IKZ59_04630 [Clostridia bacterium]|nr:hypothetical protein [Clostridia bacterium]